METFNLDYVSDFDFIMIFGNCYYGKSYCLNKIIGKNICNTSDNMFEDGTLAYESKIIPHNNKEICLIDTPGLDSILNHKGFSSFKDCFKYIKNKKGLILLCIDCQQHRYSNAINKFKQMIDFFNSKSMNEFRVNILFNKVQNDDIISQRIQKFKDGIPLKKSGFYCYCHLNSERILYEGKPYILFVTPGFKYFPNSLYKKDFSIPIGDTTIVNKSFNGSLGKDILKIIWQIQQEFEIPPGAIKWNEKLARLIYEYNFNNEIDKETMRETIIREIDKSLNFV